MWIDIMIFSKCVYLCSYLREKVFSYLKKKVLAVRSEVNREWSCIQRNLKILDEKKDSVWNPKLHIEKNIYRCLKVFLLTRKLLELHRNEKVSKAIILLTHL